ncbi:MAG: zinc ribbon domain-containing protein [Candidatus Bathyarchaeota archaeon]|nr:zinc ribbon domain-containing protein [Candidatus Bathyarchaeota archaeon]
MVHCPKCWTKNEEDAKYCAKCGAALEGSRSGRAFDSLDKWGEDLGKRVERWGEQFGKRMEDECFGFSNVGAVTGLIIGIIIVFAGILWVAGFTFFWPVLIIVLGFLIIAGAIYGFSRR